MPSVRHFLAASVLAIGVAAASFAADPRRFNAPADVAAIHALEEYLQSETDMTKLAGLYAADALVLDIYAPGVYKGRDQIVAGFTPQLAAIQTMKHRFVQMHVATDGTLACAAMQISFDTVLKNGQALKMNLRELDAFRKIAGKWRLIQQHVSLPVDAKTGMAVTQGAITPRGPISWAGNPLPGPATSPEIGKQEIAHWLEVGAASHSLDQLMGYYGPGDDVLVYDSYYPGELRGLKEVRSYYSAIMNSYKDIKVATPTLAIDSDGLMGVQADVQHIDLVMKDGSPKRILLRQSDCMRRTGGKWYSMLEMISYPVDFTTSRAVMEPK